MSGKQPFTLELWFRCRLQGRGGWIVANGSDEIANWSVVAQREFEAQPTGVVDWITPNAKFSSEAEAEATLQPDGSFQVAKKSASDTYTFSFDTDLPEIRYLRLELLPNQNEMPGYAFNGNCAVNEIKITAAPLGNPTEAVKVKCSKVETSWVQPKFSEEALIDGDLGTAWAVNDNELNTPHRAETQWANLSFEQPVRNSGGTRFEVKVFQVYGEHHTIQRPRIKIGKVETRVAPKHDMLILKMRDSSGELMARRMFIQGLEEWHQLALVFDPADKTRLIVDGQERIAVESKLAPRDEEPLTLGSPISGTDAVVLDICGVAVRPGALYTGDLAQLPFPEEIVERAVADKGAVALLPESKKIDLTEASWVKIFKNPLPGTQSVAATTPRSSDPPRIPDPKPAPAAVEPLVDKQPVPDAEAVAAAREKLLAQASDFLQRKDRTARLGVAAIWIKESQATADLPRRYAQLVEARNLAVADGSLSLALEANRRLHVSFEGDAFAGEIGVLRGVLAAKAEAAQQLGAIIAVLQSLAAASDSASQQEEIGKLFTTAASVAGGIKDKEQAAEWKRRTVEVRDRQKLVVGLTKAYAEGVKALSANKADPEAHLKVGRYLALVRGDWPQALAELAESRESKLSAAAKKLLADPDDNSAQIAQADAWWEIAESEKSSAAELSRSAARYWYGKGLKQASGLVLAKIQNRLAGTGRSTPGKTPFEIPLHSLCGLNGMTPVSVEGKIAPGEGFGVIAGELTMEYPPVPTPYFVHEIEMEMLGADGSVSFRYGKNEGTTLNFSWRPESRCFFCEHQTFYGGTWSWGGHLEYAPGERIKLTLYNHPGAQKLFRDGREVLNAAWGEDDLRLKIISDAAGKARILRNELRPWTEADSQLLNVPPPSAVVSDVPAAAALNWHERNVLLGNRPALDKPEPFVVASTGTPMRWIAKGNFQRTQKEGGASTEIEISNGFWMGQYEVTQDEWVRLAQRNPSRTTGSMLLPVDGVSYAEVLAFCAELTRGEAKAKRLPKGYVYRLPTDAEWELAARGGSPSDLSSAPDDFWHADNSKWQVHAVGLGRPNAFGLYDVHGNVTEWVLDAWQDSPPRASNRIVDPLRLPSGNSAMLTSRGGAAWRRPGDLGFSSCRYRHEDFGAAYRGFRLALAPAVQ